MTAGVEPTRDYAANPSRPVDWATFDDLGGDCVIGHGADLDGVFDAAPPYEFFDFGTSGDTGSDTRIVGTIAAQTTGGGAGGDTDSLTISFRNVADDTLVFTDTTTVAFNAAISFDVDQTFNEPVRLVVEHSFVRAGAETIQFASGTIALDYATPTVTTPPTPIAPPPPGVIGDGSTTDRLIYLQQSPHEAPPHGVPTYYDWYAGPTRHDPYGGQYGASIAWGQIYLAVGHSIPSNVRVQIRGLRLYGWVGSSSSWMAIQAPSDNIQGAHFVESFAGNASVGSDIRDETANGGGISVTMVPGYNFHFWIGQWPRPSLPGYITQFASYFEARLIKDNPVGVDHTNTGDLIANGGNDLYPSTTATVGAGGAAAGAGEGRFAFLDGSWQVYGLATVDAPILVAHPVP
jgi:hypothetical protein